MITAWHIFAVSTLITAFCFVLLYAYWSIFPLKPIIEVPNNHLHVKNKVVHEGEALILQYHACKNVAVSGTVTRYLQDRQVVFLPSVESNQPVGCRDYEVPIELPHDLPTDTYKFISTITYKINPIRTETYRFTSDEFQLINAKDD
jgi:hypothetical protein